MDEDRQRRLKRIGVYSNLFFASFIVLLAGIVVFTCYVVIKLTAPYLMAIILPSAFGLVAIGYRAKLKKDAIIEQVDIAEHCKEIPVEQVRKIMDSINNSKIESDTTGEVADQFGSSDGPFNTYTDALIEEGDSPG